MATAVQTPFRRLPAAPIGPTLFRKQVLPFASIKHQGRQLTFDHASLQSLVDSFNGGAYDQVPFLLADPMTNRHTVDPERMRGELKGLELTADGLFELEPRGADLIRRNPKLGVSARIVPDVKRSDGRRFPLAIEHVLGTLNPVVTGMSPWRQAELSDIAASDDSVVDLSAATYDDDAVVELSDEELAGLAELRIDEIAEDIERANHDRLLRRMAERFGGASRQTPYMLSRDSVPSALELAVGEGAEERKRDLLSAWQERFGKGLK